MSIVPRGVHFIGSIPVSSAEEAFTTVTSALPNHLQRIPDGETADRSQWVNWQTQTFKHVPRLQRCIDSGLEPEVTPSIRPEQIPGMLGDLQTGYDRVAIESFQVFAQLRHSGLITPDVRFQVSVPTPLAAVQRAIDPNYQAVVEPFWEAALVKNLRRIQDEIPHVRLAIQFDAMAEIFMLERAWEKEHAIPAAFGSLSPWFDNIEDGVLERLIRLVRTIDHDIEVGFHLCYGDLHHKHFIEPVDTSLMATFAEKIVTQIDRPVAWIHMPVPKNRTDQAYYEPLKKIAGRFQERNITLVLGLVHAHDLEGTKKRVEAAIHVLGSSIRWAVATECGIGRTPPEDLASILEISRLVSQPLN